MIRSPPLHLLCRITAAVAVVGLVLATSVAATAREDDLAGRAGHVGTGAASEVLVKLAADAETPAISTRVASLPGVEQVFHTIEGIDVHVAAVAPGTAERVAAALELLPAVAYAEVNDAYELADTEEPNDSRLTDQYALDRIEAVAGWASYRADHGYGDEFPATGGATLAVVDSGIDRGHPEFADKIAACRRWLTGTGVGTSGCQDVVGHGTHVSGIAAAAADNDAGIAGVGFDAEIQALQACSNPCAFADVAAATVYAADNGADVANFSFGGSHSDAMEDAIAYAADKGVMMVAAAGNDGGGVLFPANDSRVMAVSATDTSDELMASSSRGPEIAVAAPGDAVLSTEPGTDYGTRSGTSMSAPHVSGLAALLMSTGADADQAHAAITAGAEEVEDLTREEQGAGRLDVPRSLAAIPGGASGTVAEDGSDGEPIADAEVTFTAEGAEGPIVTATTDNDGAYAVAQLQPDTYTVTATHEAYETASKQASVASGETITVNFALAEDAAPTDEGSDEGGDETTGTDDSGGDANDSSDSSDDTGDGSDGSGVNGTEPNGSDSTGEADNSTDDVANGSGQEVADVARVAGRDRFVTAAELSRQAYPDGAETAYVATGGAFPDALAGGVAAAGQQAPVLLVTGSQVPSTTAAELDRLGVQRVVILGGTGAVSASVESELATHADEVARLAGANRFATAAAVSQAAFPDPGATDTVYVASGADFPDALAGVSAAAGADAPLLLVARGELTAPTEDELARLDPDRIVLLGGAASLGDVVADSASRFADTVDRLAGPNRFATAAAIAGHADTDADTVFVATGADFPDALAAGAVAGVDGAPVLLATPDRLTDPTRAAVADADPAIVRMLGGPAALSDDVERQLRQLLGATAG